MMLKMTTMMMMMMMVMMMMMMMMMMNVQDLGGGETVMGLAVAVGAFSETPMLLFSNKLVSRLGHGGVVALATLALALRVLYYAFLPQPWLVLPAEVSLLLPFVKICS